MKRMTGLLLKAQRDPLDDDDDEDSDRRRVPTSMTALPIFRMTAALRSPPCRPARVDVPRLTRTFLLQRRPSTWTTKPTGPSRFTGTASPGLCLSGVTEGPPSNRRTTRAEPVWGASHSSPSRRGQVARAAAIADALTALLDFRHEEEPLPTPLVAVPAPSRSMNGFTPGEYEGLADRHRETGQEWEALDAFGRQWVEPTELEAALRQVPTVLASHDAEPEGCGLLQALVYLSMSRGEYPLVDALSMWAWRRTDGIAGRSATARAPSTRTKTRTRPSRRWSAVPCQTIAAKYDSGSYSKRRHSRRASSVVRSPQAD